MFHREILIGLVQSIGMASTRFWCASSNHRSKCRLAPFSCLREVLQFQWLCRVCAMSYHPLSRTKRIPRPIRYAACIAIRAAVYYAHIQEANFLAFPIFSTMLLKAIQIRACTLYSKRFGWIRTHRAPDCCDALGVRP